MTLQDLGGAAKRALITLASPSGLTEPSSELLEILPLAIYACDADGRILWFNRRAAELWGRTPRIGDESEKFSGSHKLYFSGQLISREQTPMAEALRTGLPVRGAQGKVERPDGSCVWAEVHIQPVEDETGKVIGAINCFHETTALNHTLDELEDFFENAAVGLHLVSRNGTIVRANNAELRMLGYAANEYVGRNITEFHVDKPTIDDILRRLLRHEEINQYPARLRAKDGSIRHVLITSNARVKDGEFVNTRCFTIDVTKQKVMEQALERRMEEQSALHEFIFNLEHAESLQDLYDCAMVAIIKALACQRASILLFDQTDCMRFVAWRGLSQSYRHAVDGHSPWKIDTKNAQPISISNMDTADLPDELKQTVKREGIQALSFIPLQQNNRLLGKFMVYYDQPHDFTDLEINLARTIARQLSFSIERIRGAESARRLVSIVESSDDAIISKDLDGIIQTWNSGAEQLFGYGPQEVIGKPVTILMPPELTDEEPKILARIRNGEKIDHYETVRRCKDGRLIDISLSVSPVRNARGRVIGASKIARDISERKRSEQKLRDSERHLQELLSAIPAAIYTTDAKGKITYFNQAAVELAGRTPVLGTDEWCVTWKLFWPDGRPLPHDQCPMAIALKEGRPIRNVEAVAERPDGTRIPFIPHPTPLKDASGKVVGGINMLVDISERRQAETNQQMLLNELNHRVKNNMQMMQSLLDSAARQIKTPEGRRVLDEASRRIAAMAAAQRVLYATTDAARFSCVEFLAAVCNTVQETLPPRIKISLEAASGQLPNDNAMPLALILNELLTNAAKHGGSSGRALIRAGLLKDSDGYTLYVEDDGEGFDFEAVKKKSSGLRLVLGLARQLRGEFSVTLHPTRCSVRFSRGVL